MLDRPPQKSRSPRSRAGATGRRVRGARQTLLLLPLLWTGCQFAPDYQAPRPAETAGTWPDTAHTTPTPTPDDALPAAAIGWRDFFTDPPLQWLIATALEENRDLREAVLQAQMAQAQYRIQRSQALPELAVEGSMQRQSLPGSVAPGSGTDRVRSESYAVGLGVTAWEIDLWGRLRNQSESALQSYLALEETRRSVQISLIAEITRTYLDWLAASEIRDLTERTLGNQRATADLQAQRLARGGGTELDRIQAQAAVHQTEALLAQAEQQKTEHFHRLAQLLGQPIDAQRMTFLSQNGSLLQRADPLPDVPAGLPSDLLIRRPDLRAAEHALIAAHADIGAARAAFFPRLALSGAIGTTSDGLSGLFADGSGFWRFAPQIHLPIFDGGRNRARLEVAEIRRHLEVARYERAIQTAFREVADVLAGRGHLLAELQAQQQRVATTQATFDLYQLRYERGLESYLSTLIWERSLYQAQRDLVDLQRRYLSNRITLYKVLGGGWYADSVTAEAEHAPDTSMTPPSSVLAQQPE